MTKPTVARDVRAQEIEYLRTQEIEYLRAEIERLTRESEGRRKTLFEVGEERRQAQLEAMREAGRADRAETRAAAAEARAEAAEGKLNSLLEALGSSRPWPLWHTLPKLVETASILLDKLDWDGHGWELLDEARTQAGRIDKEVRAVLSNKPIEEIEEASS